MLRRPAAVLLLSCALLSSGCSWTFIQRGPKKALYGERIPCREDKFFPLVDVGIAALYPIGAAARLAAGTVTRGDGTVDPAPPAALLIPLALAGASLFGWSAWSGHVDTEHCRQLREDWERAQLREEEVR